MLFYIIGCHWRGEYPLLRAFWINALGALLLTQTLVAAVPHLLAYVMREDIWVVENSTLAAVLRLILPGTALLWAAVGVWRSANVYSRDYNNLAIWPMLARITVVCGGGAGAVYLYFRMLPVWQWVYMVFHTKP